MPRSSSSAPWILVGLLGLAALVGGLWMILAEPEAPLAPSVIEAPPSKGSPTAPPVNLPEPVDRPDPGEPVTPSEEELTGGLRGRLVDRLGLPVGPALVEAYEGSGIPIPRMRAMTPYGVEIETDNSGEFLLERIPRGNRVTLRISGAGFAVTESDLFSVGAGEITDVGTIVVEPGIKVTGLVLGPNGRPVAGARVGLHTATTLLIGRGDREPVPDVLKLTNDDGEFEFDHVPMSPFQMLVAADGYATNILRPHMVDLQYGDGTYNNVIYLELEKTLHGYVYKKSTGEPLKELTITALPTGVSVSRGTAISDEDGKFVVRGLKEGAYNIYAEGPGWVAGNVRVREERFGLDELKIFLEPSGSLRGRVIGPDGELVKRFDINARWAGGRDAALGGSEAKDRVRDGAFAFDDMLPGWYSFEVWAPGYAPTTSAAARLMPGEELTVTVPLKKASTLRGVVLNDAEEPVPGAKVSLRMNGYLGLAWLTGDGHDAIWFQSTTTDKNGRFELADLMRGIYQVEVTHSKYAVARVNGVQAPLGRTRELDEIYLERSGEIRGVVLDGSGNPLPKAEVSMGGKRPDGTNIPGGSTLSNQRGEYIFRNLQPGRYTIQAFRKDIAPFDMIEPTFAAVRDMAQGQGDYFVDVLSGQTTVYNVSAWDN